MVEHSRRVAFVSGGGSRLVLPIARALVNDGFDLAICDSQSVSEREECTEPFAREDTRVLRCRGDIESEDDRRAVLDAVRSQFGRLDVYIHCAGTIEGTADDVLALTEAEFDRISSTALKGPYFLTQLFAQWMVEQRRSDTGFRSAIINVNEVRITAKLAGAIAYHISRAGIGMATQLWAHRLAEFGIPVYEVRSGTTAGDADVLSSADRDEQVASESEMGYRGKVVDSLGRTVAMLARGELAFATGNVLYIESGLALRQL